MTHTIKIWPNHFANVVSGKKRAELRLNDRNYQVGDTVLLDEWSPTRSTWTGSECKVVITHVITGDVIGLMPEYCVFSFNVERVYIHEKGPSS